MKAAPNLETNCLKLGSKDCSHLCCGPVALCSDWPFVRVEDDLSNKPLLERDAREVTKQPLDSQFGQLLLVGVEWRLDIFHCLVIDLLKG